MRGRDEDVAILALESERSGLRSLERCGHGLPDLGLAEAEVRRLLPVDVD